MTNEGAKWAGWQVLLHSIRTAVAALTSLQVAGLFHLPQSYWAPITTLVITQSSLGAALSVSGQRFVGTALGALLGGMVASYFGSNLVVFGACVFLLGLVCAAVRADWSAYRLGGVTLSIVLLLPRTGPASAWKVAFHRFAEVSVGIAVALLFAWVWPEGEATRASMGKIKADRSLAHAKATKAGHPGR
jgi:uncharacterized membrane protein YgaE (UPF0421/DUF939 family)